MKNCIIFDIDGTLTLPVDKNDPSSRGYFDWARVGEDKPNKAIIYVYNKITPGNVRIIVSGRKEQARQDTVNWLKSNGIEFDFLYLRADDDNRPGKDYKLDIFNAHIKGDYFPLLSVDDDPVTSKMWSSQGIPTLQVLGNA